MKYRIGILPMFLAAALCGQAARLTPTQALARVEGSSMQRLGGERRLQLMATPGNVYVFSSGEGFALVSADDCAPALLGYASEGKYSEGLNPSLAWWIGEYNRQIDFAREHGREIRRSANAAREPIDNICKTLWNQEAPYNADCPRLNGHATATGCVATAMAQVMKVYNYPTTGIGTHSYHWAKGDTTLTFDYGATTFDWANMTDTYGSKSTAAEKAAVAQLMYACGVSVNMIYGPESGAYSQSMGPAMQNLFGYDTGGWMPWRDYYPLEEWETMIYDNLAAGMPILYTGTGSDGGHQFVCDGYNTDGYFHFNWGWGGLSDGYFLLTALEPAALGVGGGDGGFDYGQAANLGIRPPVEGSVPHYLLYCTSGITSVPMKYKLSAKAFFKGHYTNESYFALPTGAMLGMEIIPKEGTDTIRLEGRSVAGLGAGAGIGGLTVSLPALEEGEYTLRPAMLSQGAWTPVLSPMSGNPSFEGVVRGDSIFLSTPDKAVIGGYGLTMDSELIWGRPFSCSIEATNTGTREFIGNIIPQLLTIQGDSLIASGEKQPIDVPMGDTLAVTYTGTWTLNKAHSDTPPTPGNYLFRMVDAQGVPLGDTLHVSLLPAPSKTTIKISHLHLITSDPSEHRNEVLFGLTAECTAGYWSHNIEVLIFPGSGGEWLISGETGDVFLNEGESREFTVPLDMSTLGNGTFIAMTNAGGLKGNEVYFHLDAPTGVEAPEVETSDGPVRWYRIDGLPVDGPTGAGIYIRLCGGRASKVAI